MSSHNSATATTLSSATSTTKSSDGTYTVSIIFILIGIVEPLGLTSTAPASARTGTGSAGFLCSHHVIGPLPVQPGSSCQITAEDTLRVLVDGYLPPVEALELDDFVGGS